MTNLIITFISSTILVFAVLSGISYFIKKFYMANVSYTSFRVRVVLMWMRWRIKVNARLNISKLINTWFNKKEFVFQENLEWSILEKIIQTDLSRAIMSAEKSFKESLSKEELDKLIDDLKSTYSDPFWGKLFSKKYKEFIKMRPELKIR